MATQQKLSEVGWMYSAPAKRQSREEVRVPPTSQIPLLGNMPDELLPPEREPMQGLIKSTDSAYIVMAKTGGRKDLLRFRENQPRNDEEARGYPRCDWFYLEDNRISESEQQDGSGQGPNEPWEFRLPDYMVHCPRNNQGKAPTGIRYGPGERGRPPFATDSMQQQQQVPNHMQRFDKRNKLPEVRKPGFGVRQQRNEKADAKARDSAKGIAVQAKPHSEDELRRKARRAAAQNPSSDNSPKSNNAATMGKLLSMGYAKEWEESHEAYEREKAEAAKAQAEKLRRLQARIQENEVKQQTAGQKLTEGGMQSRHQQKQQQGHLKPWKPTTKAGDLL